MLLPAIFICLHLLTGILFFIKFNKVNKFKNPLITTHVILFLVLLIDFFIINLKGAWPDRLLVVAFLLTGSLTFAIYRKLLPAWQKIYFGFYLFYPIVVASTFMIDKIMFVVVASPLLACLTVPETKFSSGKYELRETTVGLAPVRLALVKKGFVTEKHLGISNNGNITYSDISGLRVIRETSDTTTAIVKAGGKYFEVAFYQ